MIKLTKIPQRADKKVLYEVDNDVLTITLDGIKELVDFTEFGEGFAETIEMESLSINPILKAEKIADTINIKVLQFYSQEEKHLFEVI